MNLVLTMALGSRVWGDFALNLCLSIRATNPKAKIGLIHDGRAIDGLEEDVQRFFDYSYRLGDSEFVTSYEQAFYTKTQLWDIAKIIAPDYEACIYLDADVLMLPGRSVDDWFAQHRNLAFTAWNNGYYNYENKATFGRGYTFWCEPEDAKAYFNNEQNKGLWNAMPQINSSFLYFKPRPLSRLLFSAALNVWMDKGFKYKPYKGVKPDELCFNVACAMTGVMPHQNPYYPVFFQFASENHEEVYIMHGWPALGFAGEGRQSEHLCAMYNRYVAYYRMAFGIDDEWAFDNTVKQLQDSNPIRLERKRQRTLYRRGEIPGSLGGVFNPSGIVRDWSHPDFEERITIYRKEANHNIKVGYLNESSVPYIHFLSASEEFERELKVEGFAPGERLEDFRLFMYKGGLMCSHTVITSNLRDNMKGYMCISSIDVELTTLTKQREVKLPIKTKAVEKNWVFFEDIFTRKRLMCIYSLNPYQLFMWHPERDEWLMVPVMQPELKWWHYGQFICNSTNPVLIGDSWLVWFHTKENGIYHHGVALINAVDLNITHYTRNSILIKEPYLTEGIGKGIVYVSGILYLEKENTVRVFFGEADSSSCYVDFDAKEFIETVKKYPV